MAINKPLTAKDGLLDSPEEFGLTLIWKGCVCSEDERGSYFDSNYQRHCGKCSSKLDGKLFDNEGKEVKYNKFWSEDVVSAVRLLKEKVERYKKIYLIAGLLEDIDECFQIKGG